MEIRLGRLLAGAKNAEGTVVIIDVYRAFTTAAVAFLQGAKKIVLVADVDEALALRERGVGCWCVGEVDGKRPEGFDFGNSPHELSKVDATGRTLILSNGGPAPSGLRPRREPSECIAGRLSWRGRPCGRSCGTHPRW